MLELDDIALRVGHVGKSDRSSSGNGDCDHLAESPASSSHHLSSRGLDIRN